jgi:bifunctional DNA-binding transcriptional regulator/antitoxin component of YhaV-PrlF toxin-antitoxin module
VSLPKGARRDVGVDVGDYVLVGADAGKIVLSRASVGTDGGTEVEG